VCVENDGDGDQRYRGVSDGRNGAGHGACRDGRAQHRGPGAAPSLRREYYYYYYYYNLQSRAAAHSKAGGVGIRVAAVNRVCTLTGVICDSPGSPIRPIGLSHRHPTTPVGSGDSYG